MSSKFRNPNYLPDPLRIMVVAGWNGTYLSDIEIVNISITEEVKPKDYPFEGHSIVGAYLDDGKAHVCGGYIHTVSPYVDSCYEYSFSNDEWSKSAPLGDTRYAAASSLLANGSWFVHGGHEGLRTSDLFEGNSFIPGPDSPHQYYKHCLVQVNSSHLFITGGVYESSSSYFLNVDTKEWIQMPDMAASVRFDHACGLVENGNGEREIVVAGGDAGGTFGSSMVSSEIFSLTNMEWRDGPDFPIDVNGAASVQLSQSFLVVGGFSHGESSYLDGIYEFDRLNYTWSKKNQTLKTARRYHTAILLPNDLEVLTT